MIWLSGLPGDPRTLSVLALKERLDTTDTRLSGALTELSKHELCEYVHLSYDLNREEPHILILSQFAKDVAVETMLEITSSLLSSLTPVLVNEPQVRVVHFGGDGSRLGWSEIERQDLFVLEGNYRYMTTDCLESVESLMISSAGMLDPDDDDEEDSDKYYHLGSLDTGLTAVLPGDTRRMTVLFRYRNQEDRDRYIDPKRESYDYDGRWDRYQQTWIDTLTWYQQQGATVESFSVNLRPWPPIAASA